MNEQGPIVIVGGGHAGAQLCGALAGAGLGARVHLVCDEAELPYQRPPLSKAFLKDAQQAVQLHRAERLVRRGRHHAASRRRGGGHRPRRAARAAALGRRAALCAAGARHRRRARARCPRCRRRWPTCAALRSAADALRLRGAARRGAARHRAGRRLHRPGDCRHRARARQAGHGAGSRRRGCCSRSVSPELAEHVLATHRASGIDLRLGVKVGDFAIDGDRLASLSVDGQRAAGRAAGDGHRRRAADAAGAGRGPGLRQRHRRGRGPAHVRPGDPGHRRLRQLSRARQRPAAASRIGAERQRPGAHRAGQLDGPATSPTAPCPGSGRSRAACACRWPG